MQIDGTCSNKVFRKRFRIDSIKTLGAKERRRKTKSIAQVKDGGMKINAISMPSLYYTHKQ